MLQLTTNVKGPLGLLQRLERLPGQVARDFRVARVRLQHRRRVFHHGNAQDEPFGLDGLGGLSMGALLHFDCCVTSIE
jgi:hypothetical protein